MRPTPKQEIERLEQLIRVMRGLPRHERQKHFNMSQWGVDTKCGTSMCAAGFCGADSWFRRRGFKIVPWGFDRHIIRYKELASWSALYEFFGTMGLGDSYMSHPIFGEPRTVGEVIRAASKRIRELRK